MVGSLKWYGDHVGPFAGMVGVTLAQVSNLVVMKAAMSQGKDKNVILAYSSALCSLIWFLCCIIFHRSASSHPPITFDITCGFISVSVLNFLAQICGYAGIQYSSPTLGTAVGNTSPAFTFILAVIFRMEKVDWRSSSSHAKIAGTIVLIAGAFVVTFYEGTPILKAYVSSSHQQQSNWIFGGLLLAIETLMLSAINIVLILVLKKYMAPFLMLFYTYCFNTTLLFIYGMVVVEDSSAWRLRLDMGLVAILGSVVTTLLTIGVTLWCLWKTGPLYVSLFKPLAIIFGIVMSVFFLGDALGLGSVIGSTIIVIGFYGVVWGKAKEKELKTEIGEERLVSNSNKLPLLQNKIQQV